MSDIKERLDILRGNIQEEDFLLGKGLSNEVNIRMFCYDAKDEMIVQHFVEQLKTDQSLNCRLIEVNLYETFLSRASGITIWKRQSRRSLSRLSLQKSVRSMQTLSQKISVLSILAQEVAIYWRISLMC